MFFKRTAPPPFMTTFDAPNREGLCARRERSNTPLQALQLMNDVQYFEAARGLALPVSRGLSARAARIWRRGSGFGFETVLARPPAPDEFEVIRPSWRRRLARYKSDPEAAAKVVAFGNSKPAAGVDASELVAGASRRTCC